MQTQARSLGYDRFQPNPISNVLHTFSHAPAALSRGCRVCSDCMGYYRSFAAVIEPIQFSQKALQMRIPVIRGVIDRRVLVNFRVDAEVLTRLCPSPFRPQIVNGFGVAGICLIRLKHIRPNFLPAFVGISSENAAHRIAVEWEANGRTLTGVYVPRRDTSSLLNVFAGGRIFPGVHHHARFDVRETDNNYHLNMDSLDGSAHVSVDGIATNDLPIDSIFSDVAECSHFFQAGSVGYSPSNSSQEFDGLELRTRSWNLRPLDVLQVRSSFFEDRTVFPQGSVTFDSALLMRGIEHEWHSRDSVSSSGPFFPEHSLNPT